jgi:hypothetical protein
MPAGERNPAFARRQVREAWIGDPYNGERHLAEPRGTKRRAIAAERLLSVTMG